MGLLLSQIGYFILSNKPYLCPVKTISLITPQGATHHGSTGPTQEHGEYIRLFQETLDVKMALIKNIVAAIGKD